MPNKIAVILEQRENKIKKASLEAISEASKLASQLNFESEVIAVGNEIENLDSAAKYGISKIIHLKNENLKNYSSSGYAEAIFNYLKDSDFKIILLPNTALGKDLAPLIAVKLNAGILMDCIKFKVEGEEIIATRPIYAGKAIIDAKLKTDIKIFSLRPNVFKAEEIESAEPSKIEAREIPDVNLKSKVVEFKVSSGKMDVAEADIIVSGGRGLKSSENFKLIEELAEAIGGAVGASRAVVDAGWRSHREQVGQTGKTVSPSLYVACGISGAIQHLAGMSSSKYIVAINKDKDAPIFSIADYGIAGDVFEIVPKLTEEIKRLKS